MKRKRFSVEQIVAVLKQAELGTPVADLIHRVGISEQTFYGWKKQHSGLQSRSARSDPFPHVRFRTIPVLSNRILRIGNSRKGSLFFLRPACLRAILARP